MINQPITIPPIELDTNGKVIMESIKTNQLDFNKRFHPEFTGYMIEQKDGIWISYIESKDIGKGNFSKLITELKEKYNWIKIPTPSKMMMKIATHLGFDIKNEYFESPYECMGTIMTWYKQVGKENGN